MGTVSVRRNHRHVGSLGCSAQNISRQLHNPVCKAAPKPNNIVLWHIGTFYYRGTVSAGKFKHVAWKNLQQEMRGDKPLALKNQWGGPISKKGMGDPTSCRALCLSLCTPRACSQTQKMKMPPWHILHPC